MPIRARLLRMRKTGENREVTAMLLDHIEISGRRVVAARLRGKEVCWIDAQAGTNRYQPLRWRRIRSDQSTGPHRIQKWQRERNTRATQKSAPGER